jgi:ribosomal protein S18 acetylase RimI-like enzyme
MIRLAEIKDIPQIRIIWKICFGDVDEYLDYYFSQMFNVQNTLLYVLDEKAVAMLQMLPAFIQVDEKFMPVQYIFAAATLPEYRKRGIMAELIDEALKIGETRGQILSVLKPTNKKLFGFYEHLGYQADFMIDKITFSRRELIDAVKEIEVSDIQLNKCWIDELYKMRENYLKGRDGAIIFPLNHIKAEANNYCYSYGGVWSFKDCYAFCIVDHQRITCNEFSYNSRYIKEFCALLLNQYPNHKEFIFMLPENTSLFGKTGETLPLCMSRKIQSFHLKSKPYLNMTLA